MLLWYGLTTYDFIVGEQKKQRERAQIRTTNAYNLTHQAPVKKNIESTSKTTIRPNITG